MAGSAPRFGTFHLNVEGSIGAMGPSVALKKAPAMGAFGVVEAGAAGDA